MTWFLNPHVSAAENWTPKPKELETGVNHCWLTADGIPGTDSGCLHPECIKKRMAWYAQAVGKPVPTDLDFLATRPYSRSGPMAQMHSTVENAKWHELLAHYFKYKSCGTCNTSILPRMPAILQTGGQMVWFGPGKQWQLTAYTYAQRLDNLRCLCGRTYFPKPVNVVVLNRLPGRVHPKRAQYWWLLEALRTRRSETTAHAPRRIDQSISIFYGLEGLRHDPGLNALAGRNVAAQRIAEEADIVFKAFTAELAVDLLAYLQYAVASELRHTRLDYDSWEDTVHYDCWRSRTRQCEACEWLEQYNQGDWKKIRDAIGAFPGGHEAYWVYADHVFDYVHWERGFGGKAWGTITKAGGEFVMKAMTPTQFVDRTFNLKHNGGLCFDKNGKMVLYGRADVMRLLDIKRNARGLTDLAPLVRNIPTEYEPLWVRALALLVKRG